MKTLGRKCNKLYDMLDIDRHATPEEIKRAYYTRAKQLHPDRGGDPKEFNDLHNAYLTLSDPFKKKRYDQTGEHIKTTFSADINLMQGANELIAIKFDAMIQKHKIDTIHMDIVGDIKSSIKKDIDGMRNNIKNLKESVKFLKKLNKRIKYKGGSINMMEAMIIGIIVANEKSVDDLKKRTERYKVALKVMNNYTFAPEPKQQQGWVIQTFGTGTSTA